MPSSISSAAPSQQPPPQAKRAGSPSFGKDVRLVKPVGKLSRVPSSKTTRLPTATQPPAPRSPPVTPRIPGEDEEKKTEKILSFTSIKVEESKAAQVECIAFTEVDRIIRSSLNVFGKDKGRVLQAMCNFIDGNAVAASSPNLSNGLRQDALTGLMMLFAQKKMHSTPDICYCSLKCLKILLRKLGNRTAMTNKLIDNIVIIMEQPQSEDIATECSNVCLNMCYETDNVEKLIDAGGIAPLHNFLKWDNVLLKTSAAGAIQSICFQEYGRVAVRESSDAIGSLVQLMKSQDPLLLARAVGAIHNISSDRFSIHLVREAGGLPILVDHLRTPNTGIPASAAGALQNMSREVASQAILNENEKVRESLADLLFGNDETAVSCAVGALLNILGDELGPESDSNETRKAFKKMLADSIAMGAVWQACFETMDVQDQC
jgi:hypothetical protein|eukprot:g5300.t1